jgi:hypothetical protein
METSRAASAVIEEKALERDLPSHDMARQDAILLSPYQLRCTLVMPTGKAADGAG